MRSDCTPPHPACSHCRVDPAHAAPSALGRGRRRFPTLALASRRLVRVAISPYLEHISPSQVGEFAIAEGFDKLKSRRDRLLAALTASPSRDKVSEPTIPYPTVPEPTLPYPTVPEPTLPYP